MKLVQIPECGGFDLLWADKLRKSIAKKSAGDFEKLEKEYFQVVKEKGLSKNLCNYVWKVLISMSKGYGFNASHTLAYSIVGLQELNLAYKFPIVFWNCACLIADSGGDENDDSNDEDEGFNSDENYNTSANCIIESFDDNDDEDLEDDDENTASDDNKKKKKSKVTNYGKIATAIGKMQSAGVKVFPPDINKSTYTFTPDAKENIIRYGLSGIARIGDELVQSIIENRPYCNIQDLIDKNKITKLQLINLIKSGALDCFGDRVELMRSYIDSICDKKQRLTLQNMQMLINYNLIPEEMDFYRRLFNFNKYLRKNLYYIDDKSLAFLNKYFSIDDLKDSENQNYLYKIEQNKWSKIYNKNIEPMRQYLKNNSKELLNKLNNLLFDELWSKDCLGNISQWEMDSISFYYHPHELSYANEEYRFDDFFELPEEPVIQDFFKIKGKSVPIYKLNRIAGTVLNKDKLKNTITLLTLSGVVNIKIWQNQFVKYDKQISQKDEVTGKKKVIEKSWFTRGNKLIVVGIRRDDTFIPKIYKNSIYSTPISLITNINNNGEILTKDRREE